MKLDLVTDLLVILLNNSKFDNEAIDNTRINQISTVFIKNESKEQLLSQGDAHIIFDLIMSSPGS